jgi:hypothetical protein
MSIRYLCSEALPVPVISLDPKTQTERKYVCDVSYTVHLMISHWQVSYFSKHCFLMVQRYRYCFRLPVYSTVASLHTVQKVHRPRPKFLLGLRKKNPITVGSVNCCNYVEGTRTCVMLLGPHMDIATLNCFNNNELNL